jgi:hypothetical protein
MAGKSEGRRPASFHDYIASLSKQHARVRLLLSNGERREGVLAVHDDYVTFEDQVGGIAIAHIAAIDPLDVARPTLEGAVTPRHGQEEKHRA